MGMISNVANSAYNAAASGTAGLVKATAAVAATVTELSMLPGQYAARFAGRVVGSATGTLMGAGKAIYNCRDENTKSLKGYVIENICSYSNRAVELTDKRLFKDYQVTSVSGICGYAVAAATTGCAAAWLGGGMVLHAAAQLIHAPKVLFHVDVIDSKQTHEGMTKIAGDWYQCPSKNNILINNTNNWQINLTANTVINNKDQIHMNMNNGHWYNTNGTSL